jgi:hypothetical protein
MSVASLLLPVFVQVGLTFVLMAWMASRRVTEVKAGTVRPKDIALRQPNWPDRTTQIANCFHNQLELPMLFYVLVALILVTDTNSTLFVLLAWLFVITRLVHAFIHSGSNRVDQRFYAMAAGMVLLVVMWVIFAARIIMVEGV